MKHKVLLITYVVVFSANPVTIANFSLDALDISLSGAILTRVQQSFSAKNPFISDGINSYFSGGQFPAGIRSAQFSQSFRISKKHLIAGSFRFLDFGLFEGMDDMGNPTEQFAAYEQIVSAGIQRDISFSQFPPRGQFAFSIHGISQRFSKIQKQYFFGSVAFRYPFIDDESSIAIVWDHFGKSGTKFIIGKINLSIGRQLAYLPLCLELAANWDFSYEWTVRTSGVVNIGDGIWGRFGFSTLRFGQTTYTIWDFINATSVGFGIQRGKNKLDYGISFLGGAGTIQAISWSF